jgi:hypothetical protein
MENKFIKCECHTHALELSVDKEADVVYVALWNYGNFSRNESFWERIKIGFRYIFTKKLYGDHVIIGREQAVELNEFIQTHLKDE